MADSDSEEKDWASEDEDVGSTSRSGYASGPPRPGRSMGRGLSAVLPQHVRPQIPADGKGTFPLEQALPKAPADDPLQWHDPWSVAAGKGPARQNDPRPAFATEGKGTFTKSEYSNSGSERPSGAAATDPLWKDDPWSREAGKQATGKGRPAPQSNTPPAFATGTEGKGTFAGSEYSNSGSDRRSGAAATDPLWKDDPWSRDKGEPPAGKQVTGKGQPAPQSNTPPAFATGTEGKGTFSRSEYSNSGSERPSGAAATDPLWKDDPWSRDKKEPPAGKQATGKGQSATQSNTRPTFASETEGKGTFAKEYSNSTGTDPLLLDDPWSRAAGKGPAKGPGFPAREGKGGFSEAPFANGDRSKAPPSADPQATTSSPFGSRPRPKPPPPPPPDSPEKPREGSRWGGRTEKVERGREAGSSHEAHRKEWVQLVNKAHPRAPLSVEVTGPSMCEGFDQHVRLLLYAYKGYGYVRSLQPQLPAEWVPLSQLRPLPPYDFLIQAPLAPDRAVGLISEPFELSPEVTGHLVIHIQEDSVLDEWNRTCAIAFPRDQLLPGDLILAVGEASCLKGPLAPALREPIGVLELQVVRFAAAWNFDCHRSLEGQVVSSLALKDESPDRFEDLDRFQ
ncbi:unnamed protein product [Effrenium voratum]|uniref:Uncharacterized protein n=1 Tax=Effrenium voratum TaxID=2562239 RepID=A0AA36J7H2_9DINO|nr:unnamed protein product [Effrenium voratum]